MEQTIKTIDDLDNVLPNDNEPIDERDKTITELQSRLELLENQQKELQNKYNNALEANQSLFMRLTSKATEQTSNIDILINKKVGI